MAAAAGAVLEDEDDDGVAVLDGQPVCHVDDGDVVDDIDGVGDDDVFVGVGDGE